MKPPKKVIVVSEDEDGNEYTVTRCKGQFQARLARATNNHPGYWVITLEVQDYKTLDPAQRHKEIVPPHPEQQWTQSKLNYTD